MLSTEALLVDGFKHIMYYVSVVGYLLLHLRKLAILCFRCIQLKSTHSFCCNNQHLVKQHYCILW